SCVVPILAEQAMSRVRWRTEQSEACPGRGPARITLRVLRRKKKRRRNRQPPAAARGRPLPWCPAATAGGQGKEHATRHWCPAAHSPASKRPFVQPRSAATDEGCGGTLPPRCPPAHARASSGTSVRLLSLCTRSACNRGPPAPMPAWHLRDAPGGCHPAAAVLPVSAA